MWAIWFSFKGVERMTVLQVIVSTFFIWAFYFFLWNEISNPSVNFALAQKNRTGGQIAQTSLIPIKPKLSVWFYSSIQPCLNYTMRVCLAMPALLKPIRFRTKKDKFGYSKCCSSSVMTSDSDTFCSFTNKRRPPKYQTCPKPKSPSSMQAMITYRAFI